jgi:hypothetical protein
VHTYDGGSFSPSPAWCPCAPRCSAVSYAAAFALLIVIQPFITSVTIAAAAWGIHINFGACRAVGSLSYAVMAAVMGAAVERLGTGVRTHIRLSGAWC